jgi:hypothetical protein
MVIMALNVTDSGVTNMRILMKNGKRKGRDAGDKYLQWSRGGCPKLRFTTTKYFLFSLFFK